MRKMGLWLGLMALVGCHSELAPEDHGGDLVGLTLPINADGRLKLEVAGQVGSTPAELALDVSEPLSLIADGCFPDGAPGSDRTVRVPKLAGGFASHPEITVREVMLGSTRLGALRAGLVTGVKDCQVTLGSDVLDAYALRVDPAHRILRFLRAGASASVQPDPSQEVTRLELSRDPQTDWLLLPIRVQQDDAQLTGPVALVTDATRSHLSAKAAAAARLRPATELLNALHLPVQLPVPESLGGTLLSTDSLELSPALALRGLDLSLVPDWQRETPLGTLGSDTWGRFEAVIDPSAHTLLLSRPRRVGEDGGSRCGAPGQERGEACFQLESQKVADGARAIVTVWRDLKRGGRVEIEPVGADGKLLPSSCRLGFTFSPQPSGASLAQTFPWPMMSRAFPECADLLRTATRFQFSVWSEGFDRTCPGSCAFAQEPVTGRTACSCEQSPEAQFEAIRPFLDHLRELLDRTHVPSVPKEREPDEP